jgi:hypothetical protein
MQLAQTLCSTEALFGCFCRAYGPAGRAQYIRFELLDLAVFMASYGTFLSMLISKLAELLPSNLPKKQLQLANLLPWATVAADVVENVMVLVMLLTYPRFVVALVPYAAVATQAKWLLLMASAAAMVGLVVCWLYSTVTNSDAASSENDHR